MSAAPSWLALRLLDRNLLPDRVIRAGIRSIVAARLREQSSRNPARLAERRRRLVAARSTGPIAVDAASASARQDDLPADFYRRVLGPRLKHSCALWEPGTDSLESAELRMLALAAERARLADGQRILDLGCGWGALSLWMAQQWPGSRITAVTNSRAQTAWMNEQVRHDGLTNLEVVTADVNVFEPRDRYDRVVSIEMFEYMRNWQALLARIARWIEDDGRLFVQMLTHRHPASAYDAADASDWVAASLFGDAAMPFDDLLYEFADLFRVVDHWTIPGTHYQRTADAWLARLDAHRTELQHCLRQTHGAREARRQWVRWRVFFMACAEWWGSRDDEWRVSHYLMEKAGPSRSSDRDPTRIHGATP